MRISDWSSDVCSSDLSASPAGDPLRRECRFHADQPDRVLCKRAGRQQQRAGEDRRRTGCLCEEESHCEIGRASCRERVCQYVSISVVAVSLKKKEQYNSEWTF